MRKATLKTKFSRLVVLVGVLAAVSTVALVAPTASEAATVSCQWIKYYGMSDGSTQKTCFISRSILPNGNVVDSFYTYNMAWWTERLVQKLWVYVNGTARVSGCFYYNLNGQYIGSGSCSV